MKKWFLLLLATLVGLLATSAEATTCADLLRQVPRKKEFAGWVLGASRTKTLPITRIDLPIFVIGAGPGGLAVMEAFKSRGIPFEAAERADDVGGVWNTRNPESPAYNQLETNSSKATTYIDVPMPKDWPTYIPLQRAHEYLRTFAERHGLVNEIALNTEAINVAKAADGSWIVTTRNLVTGEVSSKPYRAVVVASGVNNRTNRIFPQDLWNSARENGIESLHASDYRSPEAFKGKNVLIVGVGNTGTELATEISNVAANTYVAVRSTPWIVPLWVLGKPADELAVTGPKLPHTLEMWLFNRLQRWYIGHPKKLGFEQPDHKLLDRLPVSDRGFAQAIKAGKIKLRPNLKSFEHGSAHYENASDKIDAVDVVVFATGYARNIPFLSRDLVNLENPQFEMPLHLFHPKEPGLVLMTEVIVPQGVWPIFGQQGQAVASYFAAESVAGATHVAQFNSIRANPNPDFKGHIFSASDNYHVDPALYGRALRDFSAWIASP